jgi:hypothetical protein
VELIGLTLVGLAVVGLTLRTRKERRRRRSISAWLTGRHPGAERAAR